MNRFDGILICTDLDGTLLRRDKTISEENLEAIEYFKRHGGYFTFITGRMPFYSTESYRAVRPNVPVGCVNGGGVYDYETEKYIYTIELPRRALELVRSVERTFPKIGIQVSTFDKTYFCRDNEMMHRFRAVMGLPNLSENYEEISDILAKVVFGTDSEEELLALEHHLRSHALADEFELIRSSKSLFEILPKSVGKGVSVTKLAEYLGVDIGKTVVVGDYDNDISMFESAGVAVAVENASRGAKAAADFITVSNEEHAIARVISDIENKKYGF